MSKDQKILDDLDLRIVKVHFQLFQLFLASLPKDKKYTDPKALMHFTFLSGFMKGMAWAQEKEKVLEANKKPEGTAVN